jgi:hypothetical protein
MLVVWYHRADVLELEHCAAAYYSFHLIHIVLDRFWPLLRWRPSCTANVLERRLRPA